MKQTMRFAVAALCLSLMSIATSYAQDQYTEGGVTRVTLVQILPGHFNAFLDDLKANIKPIWDAEKKAGLIENYNLFLSSTKANPKDWDIGFALSYKCSHMRNHIEVAGQVGSGIFGAWQILKQGSASEDSGASGQVDGN
jgi:hypothetical protein